MTELKGGCTNDYAVTLDSSANVGGLIEITSRLMPLVRCQGCASYNREVHKGDSCWCRQMAQYTTPHGFCAWGIRKDSSDR